MADQSIKVLITGDGAQLSKALNTASSQIAAFGKKAGTAFSSLGRGLSILGVGGAAGLAAGIKKSVDAMDDLYKASQKAGVSVEVLSKLRYAADLSGVEAQGLDNALRFLNKSLAEGAKGTKEYADALAAVGVGPADNAADALLKIADAFARMPDGAEKTALALKLFGKAGTDMIPLLNAGAAGISKMTDEAKKLGLEVSTKAAKAAEEFNDNITRLGAAVQGPFNQALQASLPTIESISSALVKASQSSRGFWQEIQSFGRFGGGFEGIEDEIGEVTEQIAEYKQKIADTKREMAELPEGGFWADMRRGALGDYIDQVSIKILRLEGELRTLRGQQVDILVEADPNAPATVTQQAIAASQAAQAAVPPIIVPMAISPVGALGSYSDLKQEFLRQQVPGNAAGGLISGPGSGTSDNVLSWLSNGEYVMRAAAVNHYGADLMRAINSMSLPRFASGGEVSFAIDFGGRRAGVARTSSTEADMISRMARRAAIQRAPR